MAPKVAPAAAPAAAEAVRRLEVAGVRPAAVPAAAAAVRRPEVAGVRPAAVPAVAARRVAGAVGPPAVILTVAGPTAAVGVGLPLAGPAEDPAVGLPLAAPAGDPAVGLLAEDLPKAAQRAEAGEVARPAPGAAWAAAPQEGAVRVAAVRTAVRAVRSWGPLLQVVEEEAVVVRTVAVASRRIRLADSILGVSGSSRWSPS